MCTIITTNKKNGLFDRIKRDSESNGDGFSALWVNGGKYSMFRSMDITQFLDVIKTAKFSRIWIHTRYATQGEALLHNTHGWNSRGVYVFHNGSIYHDLADSLEVDSMAITKWIDSVGIDWTMGMLTSETFANVFVVDSDSGEYHVNRTKSGSLYTDGNGNFSTNAFGDIKLPVDPNFQETYKTEKQTTARREKYKGVYQSSMINWKDDDVWADTYRDSWKEDYKEYWDKVK